MSGYMYISMDSLSHVEGSISVLKKDNIFECYLSFERGHIDKWAEFSTEEEVCDFIIEQSIIQKNQIEEEKFFKENGFWPSQKKKDDRG